MGCATSKPKVCEHCRGSLSKPEAPPPRSYSMHVHHFPQQPGDTYHVVALTSSTLGSLKLNRAHSAHYNVREDEKNRDDEIRNRVSEAKSWSEMIEQKIPKNVAHTPVQTPPGEPETINAWELMEGLEDTTPDGPDHHRSFSFHVSGEEKSDQSRESMVVDPVPEAISEFKKVVEELPPNNPFHIKTERLDDVVPSGKKEKLVVYFTSLRGIRKTYEDCCRVRAILKGLGVKVDERDVSMHSGFKGELKELLGDEYSGARGSRLPKVFVGGKYIGGMEEIRRMHESGRLEKVVGGCEKMDDDGGGDGNRGGNCEGCGDVRFVPCRTCSGSCKVYYEGEYEDGYGEYEEDEYGFQRCPDCNENGLIRCPICCD